MLFIIEFYTINLSAILGDYYLSKDIICLQTSEMHLNQQLA